MNHDNADELMDRLTRLDPVAMDAPPEIGSLRYVQSKEQAVSNNNMSNNNMSNNNMSTTSPNLASKVTPLRRSKEPRFAFAAAAVIAAVVAMTLVLPGGGQASAAVAVREAAANSADITALRIEMESTNLGFVAGGQATIEVDGQDVRLIAPGVEYYLIDDVTTVVVDGRVIETDATGESIAPYGESSRLVIDAALQSDDVTDHGIEIINGAETTRYVVQIDANAHDALADVPSVNLIWFTEETEEDISVTDGQTETFRSGFLEDADTLTIWIADDLIHRISVDSGSTQFTHTYYDFNADITIALPE